MLVFIWTEPEWLSRAVLVDEQLWYISCTDLVRFMFRSSKERSVPVRAV